MINKGDVFPNFEYTNRVAGEFVNVNLQESIKGKKVVEKKAKRSGKKTSDWIDHVKAFYAEKKKTNPDYKYSQALKDAKATYKQ